MEIELDGVDLVLEETLEWLLLKILVEPWLLLGLVVE